MARVTPLGAVARGLAAGVIGTAAMTVWQELSMKLQNSDEDGGGGENPASGQQSDPWGQASTPAKVGRKIIEGVFNRKVSPQRIGILTNAMHWAYGTSWGALYGLTQGSDPGPALRRGLLFGTGVWTMSYLILVPMGLYQPPWMYGPKQLALDVSYHLVYGAGVGGGYAALDR
jgi:hypothetical protein